MPESPETLRGVLRAYRLVADASWPTLHPTMAGASARWGSASADELRRELDGYVRQASAPDCGVRVFWKLAPGYAFAGCNAHFARDAGFAKADEMLGLDDFDKKLPWHFQGAKYRQDDEAVVASAAPKLDIIERQKSPTGEVSWVRVGKAPIVVGGEAVGVLGMYEVLDAAVARQLYADQLKKGIA